MNIHQHFKNIFILAGCICLAVISRGQDGITLHIGDPAPELQYSKWIKGTPVAEYEKDRLYVFEFWATWCGPCKAAMPHLSELAKKYADKATFVGVNVWEKTGDKPYETSLPAVTKFVSSIGDKMAYNVVADNNDQHMGNKWMKAAGQNGIPATFLLREGKIIWIGHPMKLDSVMGLVIAGKYDMASFSKEFEQQSARSAAMSGQFRKVLEPIQEAIRAKEFTKAFDMIDKAIPGNPMLAISLKHMKFTTMLDHMSEDSAMAFARTWIGENKGMGSMVAMAISGKDGLSRQAYLYSADLFKVALENDGIVKPIVYHELAKAYSKAGDLKEAVAAEEKAIQGAKDALKEGKWLGTILDYTVAEYEESLAGYKKAAK